MLSTLTHEHRKESESAERPETFTVRPTQVRVSSSCSFIMEMLESGDQQTQKTVLDLSLHSKMIILFYLRLDVSLKIHTSPQSADT